jgi:hypothetical protein
VVNPGTSRTARPLLQGFDNGPRIIGSADRSKADLGRPGEGSATSSNPKPMHGADVEHDLVIGVQELNVHEGQGDAMHQMKERVSFGTNMTTEYECSKNDLCPQADPK